MEANVFFLQPFLSRSPIFLWAFAIAFLLSLEHPLYPIYAIRQRMESHSLCLEELAFFAIDAEVVTFAKQEKR